MRNQKTKLKKYYLQPFPHESVLLRFLRGIGFMGVIIGVIFLFWQNNKQTMHQISFREVVVDATNTLTSDQIKSVNDLSRAMEKRFGYTLAIRIIQGDLSPIESAPKRIIVVLSPGKRQSLVILPPRIRHFFPPNIVEYLERRHFEQSWKNIPWPQSLSMALGLIWENMRHMEVEHG